MDEAQVIQLHADADVPRPRSAQRSAAGRTAEPAPPTAEPVPAPGPVDPSALEQRVAAGLAFLRRRLTGDYEVDEFGFDPDLTDEVLLPVFRPLLDHWFRADVIGLHNVPREGGALLVANHAGALWALDSVMCSVAVHDRHPAHRYLRLLGADLVFTTPVLGEMARKSGATLACNDDAERLLGAGELVGVFPEGFKGIGKPFSERYKLQRFGRGGFVAAALKTSVPIIPVSIVGSEEIHPMLANSRLLARLLNLPYFPITPTFPWLGPLGLVPLPSKWYLEFGDPIPTDSYGPDAVDDPMLVFELTDRVRETIQSSLYRRLVQRRSIWR
ncbi:MAG TPA: lysophospholipid acyltransferase family protein [Jatrophihabitantaceae bacterium]